MTSVLILAGARDEPCPLCEEAGVSSKALLRIANSRMIDHVLRAVRDCAELDGTVWVSGMDAADIATGAPDDLVEFAGRLKTAPVGDGPATASLAALDAGAEFPLLITTCDHPLLTPDMVSSFLHESEREGSDISVGLASSTVIQDAYPDVKRTYIKLAGHRYSGCNLFHAKTEGARKGIEFWRTVGRDRKKPMKIAQRLGYGMLFRALTGRLGLRDAFAHGSDLVGAEISPILIPIAEAAIDVDKPGDLALVKKILEKQGKVQPAAGLPY